MVLAAFLIAAPLLGASLFWLDKAIAHRRLAGRKATPPATPAAHIE